MREQKMMEEGVGGVGGGCLRFQKLSNYLFKPPCIYQGEKLKPSPLFFRIGVFLVLVCVFWWCLGGVIGVLFFFSQFLVWGGVFGCFREKGFRAMI